MNSQQVLSSDIGPVIINVGTRESQLAMVQTQTIINQLSRYYLNEPDQLKKLGPRYQSGVQFRIISMSTSGDHILDKALPDIGSESLFTKELEVALIEGLVDLVVHSFKDLPPKLPTGCAIAAITERCNPNDAIVLKKSLQKTLDPLDILFRRSCELNHNTSKARIGTASNRRIAMLRRCNQELKCINIRGNLDTRLEKLDTDDGEYDAIILAKAGLERIGWSDRVSSLLSPQTDERLADWCYAVGQGALAVECRRDDKSIFSLLAPIVDLKTTFEVAAERSLMKHLESNCSVPLGVRTLWSGEKLRKLHLESIVLSLDGTEVVKESDEIVLSSRQIDELKPKDVLLETTSDIVLLDEQARVNLVECCELGIRVAKKMIDSGCLRLMWCHEH